ncbi:MAG TPA: serine hydrolase domain-containing protein [Acidimicrobiales bacterium]|nr:serine hydrolase domain-containing protein [Acidimicrobiales bacterium]
MNNPIREWASDPSAAAEQLVRSPQVVGVAVAGIHEGRIEVTTAGVADHETGEALTPDHVLRPGSVTKLLTATLVMQCVDDGLVGLDDPVVRHLPDFRLRDDGCAERVRVGHLVSHTSGIDANDRFVDTGDDDGALGRYVTGLADVGLLTPPGGVFSYNNAAICLAGHLVATVRGTTWEEALRRHVLEPLGMTSTGFVDGRLGGDPALAARLACGHLTTPAGEVVVLPPVADGPAWTRALGPAGGRTASTAGDLGRFVASHLGGGAPAVVRPETAARMRRRVVDAPGGVHQMLGSGLGWQAWQSGELAYVRHAGAYAGASAIVAADADAGDAVVVMTNCLNGHTAVSSVLDAVPVPWPLEPVPDDLSPYRGRYTSGTIGPVDITSDERGQLVWTLPHFGMSAPIRPVDRGSFVGPGAQCAFFGFDHERGGAPEYLRFQMRVLRRVPG